MPHSLAQIYLHVVFSTKDRTPFLEDRPLRLRLHTYMAATCSNLDSPALIVDGVADHVHLLCSLGRMQTVAVLVRELKRESSKWLKTLNENLAGFYWQSGYGAFSVSAAHVPFVTEYINNQEAHHASVNFQDEYRKLLAEYGIDYDEKYLWD